LWGLPDVAVRTMGSQAGLPLQFHLAWMRLVKRIFFGISTVRYDLCFMRIHVHSEGGMKRVIDGLRGYESAMKTTKKGVL